MRKCQRQFYYRYLLASHNARDARRHEAFILKQVTNVEAWTGNLVHHCLDDLVVPALTARSSIDWLAAAEDTVKRMHRQYAFSRERKYRLSGIAKGAEPDYCALLVHEQGKDLSAHELAKVEATLRSAFSNLAGMTEFWQQISGHQNYRSEQRIRLKFEGESIEVKPDLMFTHSSHYPVIIDWKCFKSMGGSDAAAQLSLYAWAVVQTREWEKLDYSKMELLEVMPLSGEVKRHHFDEEQFIQVEDQLFEAVHGIRRVFGQGKHDEIDVSELVYANSPGSCAFCSFIEICKGASDAATPIEPVRNPKREQLQLFLPVS
jgi:CRISPR/Cas system-associated exonuclease Cas4 (RecB family)